MGRTNGKPAEGFCEGLFGKLERSEREKKRELLCLLQGRGKGKLAARIFFLRQLFSRADDGVHIIDRPLEIRRIVQKVFKGIVRDAEIPAEVKNARILRQKPGKPEEHRIICRPD